MLMDQVFIQVQGRPVQDSQAVAACWKDILKWPARSLMTYHDPPGFVWTDDPPKALRTAVESEGQLGG